MSLIFELDGSRIASTRSLDFRDEYGQPLLGVSHQHVVLQPARGTANTSAAAHTIELDEDDPVCVHLDDGLQWWMQAGEAARTFGRLNADGTRVAFGMQAAARSGAATMPRALETFRLGAGATAATLAGWYEQRHFDSAGPGLHRLDFSDSSMQLRPASVAATAQPILLFIHGTASFCALTFRHLCDQDQASSNARHALQRQYGNAIYAWQYRSLTVGPIENTLALLHCLPDGAQLHLVTHSQGGLLGELLCLAQRNEGVLTPALLDALFAGDRTQAAAWGLGQLDDAIELQQREQIGQLLALLDQKQIRVSRFVRIACPALGTTLISGRLDRWLSIFRFAASLAGVDIVSSQFLAFVLAVVKQRTDPRTLPGLEAMMPGSALIRLLNWDALEVDADLSVIAGSALGSGVLRRLEVALADEFFGGDNDLVVNTGSMYGGLRRRAARFYCAHNATISHFQYLAQAETVGLLAAALLRADGDNAGFLPWQPARVVPPARALPTEPQALAIVLPAMLCNHLQSGPQTVWLDLCQMADGGIRKLAIDAAGVIPGGLMERYYGQFIDFLAQSHEVLQQPYDWRLSVRDSAQQLAALLEARLPALEAKRLPLHIVGHSMGGLVARAMFALHPQLWQRARALPGFRLMMLGTPNGGCYQTVRLLTGQHYLANWVSLLDLRDNRDDVLAILVRYPGIADMLPWVAARGDFSQLSTWENLKHESGDSWPLPAQQVLTQAAQTWDLLRGAAQDAQAMLYVAGWAPETAADVILGPDPQAPDSGLQRLRFPSSPRGDGTVLWDQGRLPDVPMWYVKGASHAYLLAYRPAFQAYLELLQNGSTALLPDREPDVGPAAAPPGAAAHMSLDRMRPDYMRPDLLHYQPGELNFSGLGSARDTCETPVIANGAPPSLPPVDSGADGGEVGRGEVGDGSGAKVALRICHGDLAHADHPVCVGHYQGDAIVNAESQLDQALGGMLSMRESLGMYPGQAGSWHACVAPFKGVGPGGALIVGLGQVGELAPAALESTLYLALLDYALIVSDWHDRRFDREPEKTLANANDRGNHADDRPQRMRSARLCFLLIGTGAGGIGMSASLAAILRSVARANARLAQLALAAPVRIDRLDFLELYQDLALQAASALNQILADREFSAQFEWRQRSIVAGTGGLRRVWREEAPNWWDRLEIRFDSGRQQLHFVALTDRARAEQSLLSGQTRLAMDFIAQAVSNSTRDQDLSRTLFEMLTPNRLKDSGDQRRDTVLLLDQQSACFPWELLEDRWNRHQQPPAVAAGLIRQLASPRFRPRPLHAAQASALVIGNPQLRPPSGQPQPAPFFSDLPGARAEAESVARILRDARYQVTQEIDSDTTAIMIGLHADAYRILHLAGHGVFELPLPASGTGTARTVSGMAIGPGTFLTPFDVEQMRWVPELVFINCCHLGAGHSSHHRPRHHELAANLGAQFIEMGVKAVVAAGWAVDDGAARAFALAFYGAMLGGWNFGSAVRLARRRIYVDFPEVNTWGAYQCYGNPNFSLADQAGAAAAGAADEAGAPYYSVSELQADLDNFALRAALRPLCLAQLDRILQRIPEHAKNAWLATDEVAASLRRARQRLAL